MGIRVKKAYPDYEKRVTIRCTTLTISMITGGGTDHTRLAAHLDEGLDSEREVDWEFAEDHPVFVFREDVSVT